VRTACRDAVRRGIVVLLVVGVAADAHAERRAPLVWNDIIATHCRGPDEDWRWDVSAGVSAGWRPLADLRLRKWGDQAAVSAGARFRFDLADLAPRVAELELAWQLARGKAVFPGDTLMRTHLMIEANEAFVHLQPGDLKLGGALGLGLRIVPTAHDWLLFDIGVRESYMPHLVGTPGARLVGPQPVAWSFATEGSIAVSILFGR
jgi:hypothetical protein